jgi:hypothetical protein
MASWCKPSLTAFLRHVICITIHEELCVFNIFVEYSESVFAIWYIEIPKCSYPIINDLWCVFMRRILLIHNWITGSMYKEEFTIETCKPTLIIYTVFARLKITCVMKIGPSLKMSIVVVKNSLTMSWFQWFRWLRLCWLFRTWYDKLARKQSGRGNNYLAFQSFDIESTWRRLFQKRVVRTKFDVYVFNTITGTIYLLLDY